MRSNSSGEDHELSEATARLEAENAKIELISVYAFGNLIFGTQIQKVWINRISVDSALEIAREAIEISVRSKLDPSKLGEKSNDDQAKFSARNFLGKQILGRIQQAVPGGAEGWKRRLRRAVMRKAVFELSVENNGLRPEDEQIAERMNKLKPEVEVDAGIVKKLRALEAISGAGDPNSRDSDDRVSASLVDYREVRLKRAAEFMALDELLDNAARQGNVNASDLEFVRLYFGVGGRQSHSYAKIGEKFNLAGHIVQNRVNVALQFLKRSAILKNAYPEFAMESD